MRLCRTTVIWLVVLGSVALVGASGALAAGPSAGDQQYVDPLGGSTTPSSHSTPPSSSSSSSSTSTATTASSTVAPPSAATTTSSTGSTSASSAAALPRTGYDGWLAAVVGVGLLGSGLALRRQALSR